MWLMIAGAVILGTILGLIWLKDRLESVALQRIVYHELTTRMAVVGLILFVLGVMFEAKDLLTAAGLIGDGEPVR